MGRAEVMVGVGSSGGFGHDDGEWWFSKGGNGGNGGGGRGGVLRAVMRSAHSTQCIVNLGRPTVLVDHTSPSMHISYSALRDETGTVDQDFQVGCKAILGPRLREAKGTGGIGRQVRQARTRTRTGR